MAPAYGENGRRLKSDFTLEGFRALRQTPRMRPSADYPRPSARRHGLRSSCDFANSLRSLAAAADPEVQVGKYGIACLTVQQQTTPGETSYSVEDIGKQGVPALTREQISMVRRIQKYIQSRTLRFTFVRMQPYFVVFDATDGPCADFAPGYWVLNDPWPDSFTSLGKHPDSSIQFREKWHRHRDRGCARYESAGHITAKPQVVVKSYADGAVVGVVGAGDSFARAGRYVQSRRESR